MSKHPIGFRPSYPRLILMPNAYERKDAEPGRVADAIATVTLKDDEYIPYEDRTGWQQHKT